MMNTEVAFAVIKEEDKSRLEMAWYRYQALNELIQRGDTSEVVIERYTIAFGEYNRQWAYILRNYFDKDYSVGNYSWHCDFFSNRVTITQG